MSAPDGKIQATSFRLRAGSVKGNFLGSSAPVWSAVAAVYARQRLHHWIPALTDRRYQAEFYRVTTNVMAAV